MLSRQSIPILTPEQVNAPEAVTAIRELAPDLIVVMAYGQIIKSDLLRMPPLGCLNLHPSLLPKYRGAAPIAWAIVRGETVTGVTTLFMNERIDAGEILLQREVSIATDDTAASLGARLVTVGAELVIATIDRLCTGTAVRIPQEEADATLAPKLSKADGRIDWHWRACDICNRVRGFFPWPGCWCELPQGSGRNVRILRALPREGGGSAEAGAVLVADREFHIQTGEGIVQLLEVQPAGRKPMNAEAFLRGNPVPVGTRAG
jgi:methionyl-tRNA formyltransferase